MSLSMEEGPLKEAAIFTRAVENVFRKLIRLLLGRMTLTRLQEMIRAVYIEEAEQKLKRERPGKNVPLTRLALMTGLDTRTLNRVQEERSESRSFSQDEQFLKGFSPGFRVLDTWLNNVSYQNSADGKPLEIRISGEGPSFEDLFARSVPARGVTAQSVLHRLAENRMVTIDAQRSKVKLNQDGIVFVGNEELDMIDIGFWSAANLLSTVTYNVKSSNEDERFFQRSCWTFRLGPENVRAFRSKMREFLESAHKHAKTNILPFESVESGSDQITAGISMFYFEDEPRN